MGRCSLVIFIRPWDQYQITITIKKKPYLRSLLTNKVQNSIAPFFYDANDYPQTIAELEMVNGHRHVIARSNVDSMLNFPIVKDNTDSLILRI